MSQPIRGQGGYLVFAIGQKNTNLVEDVEKKSYQSLNIDKRRSTTVPVKKYGQITFLSGSI